jgi:hypothetical protein
MTNDECSNDEGMTKHEDITFGAWSLELGYSLGVGAWDLEILALQREL